MRWLALVVLVLASTLYACGKDNGNAVINADIVGGSQ